MPVRTGIVPPLFRGTARGRGDTPLNVDNLFYIGADMFAVIKTGGKQYRVAKDDIVIVEKLLGEPGSTIELNEVLMISEAGKATTTGTPLVEKAAVFAEIVDQSRADKIVIFKKKRRQNYRRTAGHRQEQTVLRILEVSPTGTKPKAAAAKKTTAPKKDAATDAPKAEKAAPKKAAAPKADTAAPKEAAAPKKAEAKADAPAKKPAAKKAPAKKAAAKSDDK